MKVSVIIACLALVPFVLAQDAVVEPEAELTLWGRLASFASGLVESDPAVTIKEKAQVVFDNVKSAHDQMNEFLVDMELDPIPYEEGTYSVDEIQNKINELSGNLQAAVDGFVAKIEAFDIDSLKIDTEPAAEPEGEAEPEADADAWSFKWW